MINLGMVCGLLPVVGVTLPLFSYGGSSVLTIMIGIGLLMNISMRRFTSSLGAAPSRKFQSTMYWNAKCRLTLLASTSGLRRTP